MRNKGTCTEDTFDLEVYDPGSGEQLAGSYKSDARQYREKTPRQIALELLRWHEQEAIIELPSEAIVTVSRNRWCERHSYKGHFEREIVGRFTLGELLGEDKASEAAVPEAGGEESEETFDEAKKRWDQLIGLESTVEGSDLIYRSPMGFPLALTNLYRFKGRFHATFGQPYGIQQNWLRENGEAR